MRPLRVSRFTAIPRFHPLPKVPAPRADASLSGLAQPGRPLRAKAVGRESGDDLFSDCVGARRSSLEPPSVLGLQSGRF